jgi:hypothetical protein
VNVIDLGDIDLACVRSENLDDWYLIERAEHDGTTELRRVGYGFALWTSARISDADVEGTGAEMLALADAIDAGEDESFSRCSVEFADGGVLFDSPRNSQQPARVSVASAKALAAKIRAAVEVPR